MSLSQITFMFLKPKNSASILGVLMPLLVLIKPPSNSNGLVAMTVNEKMSEASEEVDETIEDQIQSRNENADGEEDHLERPTTSSSYVPKNLPTEAAIHLLLSNGTFPQQPQQGGGGMYPAPPPPVTAASNSKYPLPQYKPGSNTWSIGMAGSYGPYASAAPIGYNSASVAASSMESFSRNTAQKQWDETLVLVFGGIARILHTFFPLLRSLTNFWSGWESLLCFVKNNIANGSKEVALAAVGCLQMGKPFHFHKKPTPLSNLTVSLGMITLGFLTATGGSTFPFDEILQKLPPQEDTLSAPPSAFDFIKGCFPFHIFSWLCLH
ncbi:unnamed protein product [Lactuca saligna]|uniref:Mon2 C-terminal domain-containing protein n=1 Tax=Lactuca saligna TaxID=75948 RepID=A0AA35YRF2_LACSI|nr:unnamed protein product [Lactuca saligna]